ncbi:MAG: Histone acetyltransferase HPA2 and related acetyltransferases, partial [uncultured Craurococcus sp.]
ERCGGADGGGRRRRHLPQDGPAAGRSAAAAAARRSGHRGGALHDGLLPLPLRHRRTRLCLVAAADADGGGTRPGAGRSGRHHSCALQGWRAGWLLRARPAQPAAGEPLLFRAAAACGRRRTRAGLPRPCGGGGLGAGHARGHGEYLHGGPPAGAAQLPGCRLRAAPDGAGGVERAAASRPAHPVAAADRL